MHETEIIQRTTSRSLGDCLRWFGCNLSALLEYKPVACAAV